MLAEKKEKKKATKKSIASSTPQKSTARDDHHLTYEDIQKKLDYKKEMNMTQFEISAKRRQEMQDSEELRKSQRKSIKMMISSAKDPFADFAISSQELEKMK